MNSSDNPRSVNDVLEPIGSAAHRRMADLLAGAGLPAAPAGFARRLQQRIEDLAEQSRWEQGALSLLLLGMAAGAIWQLDLGWLAKLALPGLSVPDLPLPMLLSAAAACLVAWAVDRAFARRTPA